MKFQAHVRAIVAVSVLYATQLHAEEASTKDFDFLIGAWSLEATAQPESDAPRQSEGEKVCAYFLDTSYVKCESTLTNANGSVRTAGSLHNYNRIYSYHESLYYSSTWPIKPLGRSTITRKGNEILWVNEFEFPLSDDRIEYVRAEMTLSGDIMETKEFIKRSNPEDEGEFKLEYVERLVRK